MDLTIARYEPDHVIYSIDGRVYNVKHNEDSLILDDISGCTFEFMISKATHRFILYVMELYERITGII